MSRAHGPRRATSLEHARELVEASPEPVIRAEPGRPVLVLAPLSALARLAPELVRALPEDESLIRDAIERDAQYGDDWEAELADVEAERAGAPPAWRTRGPA